MCIYIYPKWVVILYRAHWLPNNTSSQGLFVDILQKLSTSKINGTLRCVSSQKKSQHAGWRSGNTTGVCRTNGANMKYTTWHSVCTTVAPMCAPKQSCWCSGDVNSKQDQNVPSNRRQDLSATETSRISTCLDPARKMVASRSFTHFVLGSVPAHVQCNVDRETSSYNKLSFRSVKSRQMRLKFFNNRTHKHNHNPHTVAWK